MLQGWDSSALAALRPFDLSAKLRGTTNACRPNLLTLRSLARRLRLSIDKAPRMDVRKGSTDPPAPSPVAETGPSQPRHGPRRSGPARSCAEPDMYCRRNCC